ncbi:MAG TPA: hypothetical protein VIV40_17245 [Kofleriaceae bacterium]
MKLALIVILLGACKSSEPKQAPPAHHEDKQDPATAPAALSLAVMIDGTPATWNADAFAKAPHMAGTNNGGESRDVWSLRELAHTLVGPSARVVSVTGENGTKPIDAAAWADATRTPILHTTRRGTLKFRWADATGAWSGEAELKDVTKLELVR